MAGSGGNGGGELRGRLVTPEGVLPGALRFDERIRELRPEALPGPLEHTPFVLPGFIDAHVHGGGGGDTMDGADGVRTLARFHGAHGTTTLLPTTITNPWPRVLRALRGVVEVRAAASAAASAAAEPLPDIPGAHLEGPFISARRLGAQPPHTLEPTPERVAEALASEALRVVTLAPELPGALDAARSFAEAGVRVSVGHTRADFDEVEALLRVVAEVVERAADVRAGDAADAALEGAARSAAGFTHLYNAMGGLEGRAPGVVGAAFAHPESYAELIADGHHVAPGALRAALQAKGERLLLVTDAIRAAGGPEGDTELGGQRVRVRGGAARLPDGTLAGSVLTLDRALRNLVAWGVPLRRASRALSAAPAHYLGLADRGELRPGLRADLVVLEPDLTVAAVYVAGRRLR